MSIGIDEQIDYCSDAETDVEKAVLATLRRMKAIEDAARELPEPNAIKCLREKQHNWIEEAAIKHIDTLRDLLAAERVEHKAAEETVKKFSALVDGSQRLYQLADKQRLAAESRCKRLVEGPFSAGFLQGVRPVDRRSAKRD